MFDLLLVITLLWKGVMLTIKVKYRDIYRNAAEERYNFDRERI